LFNKNNIVQIIFLIILYFNNCYDEKIIFNYEYKSVFSLILV